jgi:hypothetical protein
MMIGIKHLYTVCAVNGFDGFEDRKSAYTAYCLCADMVDAN